MLYILFKIINRRAYQITLCTLSGAICEEMIPGLFFSKLQETHKMVEIDTALIMEKFSAFEEILFEIKEARFFAYKHIGNIDLVIENQVALRKTLITQTKFNTATA